MAAVREWMEFAAAWLVLRAVGLLPRSLARAVGAGVAKMLYAARPKLGRAGLFNLKLAFPDWSDAQRRETLRRLVRHIGWMAGEFSQFPRYTRERIEQIVIREGYEHFAAAQARGKGVIFLTGHMSAWELAPFAQARYGDPLHFLVRPIENSRVDALVLRYRMLSGNQPIDKNQSARAMLRILREGGTVGILMDQNTLLEEGVFVDFFGTRACTSSGLARLALRTDCAVVPGYVFWDEALRKYRLHFEPAVKIARTADEEADVRENTARFTKVVEDYARRYPDQWLWVHKRWKTRPPGEPPLYPF
jgi:KDO2-lipid IV(A) lauroyltransferase